MKTLPLSLSNSIMSKVSDVERKFFETTGLAGIFETLLVQGLTSMHPQGLPLSKGKTLARLQRRIEDTPKDATSMEIEDADYDLIKEVFSGEGARFAPQQYRIVSEIAANVESAK